MFQVDGPLCLVDTYLYNRRYHCSNKAFSFPTLHRLIRRNETVPCYPRYRNNLAAPHGPYRVVRSHIMTTSNASYATRCLTKTTKTLTLYRGRNLATTVLGSNDPDYNSAHVCSNARANSHVPNQNVATTLLTRDNMQLCARRATPIWGYVWGGSNLT